MTTTCRNLYGHANDARRTRPRRGATGKTVAPSLARGGRSERDRGDSMARSRCAVSAQYAVGVLLWRRWLQCPQVGHQGVEVVGADVLVPLEGHKRHQRTVRSLALSNRVLDLRIAPLRDPGVVGGCEICAVE